LDAVSIDFSIEKFIHKLLFLELLKKA